MPISEMAPKLQLSDKYLEQLLMSLKRAGLVRSVRGANGGFVLARPPRQITLHEIMIALQGPLEFCDCQGRDCYGCVRPEFWKALQLCIASTVNNLTLYHLVSKEPLHLDSRSAVSPGDPVWPDGEGI